MLDFRYRGSLVLVHGLFLAASWLAQTDGAKNDESCSGRKDEDGGFFAPTPSMVQRSVLESAMNLDEERQEVLEVAAPDARLSKVEVPEAVTPDAPQSKVAVTPAAKVVAQPPQQFPGKSHAGSVLEARNRRVSGSSMEALKRRYTANAAVCAQLLRTMRRRVAVKFRDFLKRAGVSELGLVTTKTSWEAAIGIPLLVVVVIVLLGALTSWWRGTAKPGQTRGSFWEASSMPQPQQSTQASQPPSIMGLCVSPGTRQARGSFREASSMPQPQQATQASQPPSIMGLVVSPGSPIGLAHGKTPVKMPIKTPVKTPGKTPQQPATPLVKQMSWQAERRSATPTCGVDDNPKLSLDELAQGQLCSELVVPDDSECRLLLPDDIIEKNNMSGVLSIDDVKGMAVLYAAYSLEERPPAGRHELPGNNKRLILRSALEDIILASCTDAEPATAGGPAQLAIFNKSEELFGLLQATSPGPSSNYLVSLSNGRKMSIRRDIQSQSSCIADEDGWLLACSEDVGESGRTVRVSPQVDAGLMTLTMLGIDILEYYMAAHGSSDYASPLRNATAYR